MRNKSDFFIIGLLLFIPLLFSPDQAAHARDYAVEVIIFAHPETDTGPPESRDFSIEHISIEHIAEKRQNLQALATKSVAMETSTALENLASVRRNLVASGYRVLRAAKWVQPALVYQNAPVIDLGIAGSTLPNGFIRVYKTALIFVDINLHLIPSVPSATGSALAGPADITRETPNQSHNRFITDIENRPYQQPQYFLSEKRRLKFTQIHYFDHPRFGVIMGVWPAA